MKRRSLPTIISGVKIITNNPKKECL